jgi:hypothetical protein
MARALDLLSTPESEEYAEALGQMFGVDFDADAIDRWRTAGDMLSEIEARAAPSDTRGPAPAAKAFYLLRRALADRTIAPSTPLSKVKGTWRAASFLVHLHRRTKLVMPGAGVGVFGEAALALTGQMFLTLFLLWAVLPAEGAACGGSQGLIVAPILFGGLGLAFLFAYLDGRPFRADLTTFGDLARAVAQDNLAALWRQGAARRRADIWPALRAWLATVADVPEREVERDSRLGLET